MFNKKSLKYGGFATALSVLFIAIVIFLNMIASWAVNTFPLKVDLTDEGLYQVSPEIKQYISTIDEKIKLISFTAEAEVTPQINETLKNYSKLSNGNVEVEYVDVYTDPQVVERYSKNGNISKYSIIVESQKRFKIVEWRDLYEYKQNPTTLETKITGYKADEVLTSAMLYVTKDVFPKVYFITGHNEYAATKMHEIFTANNFPVEDINLTGGEIDSTALAVILVAPQRNLSDNEIDKIDKYMENGGNLMVFMEPTASDTANITAYLKEWGIGVNKNLILDEKSSISGSPSGIIPNYASAANAYVAGIEKSVITVMPGSSSIDILFEQKDARIVQSLFNSSPTSYIKSNAKSAVSTFEKGDIKGPFVVAAHTTRTRYRENQPYTARIFVSSSATFVYDDILNAPNYANADIISNAITLFRGEEKSEFVLKPKKMGQQQLNLDEKSFWAWAAIFVGVIPFLTIFIGIIIWFRRRHL